jgi:uncharacterized protein YidB (DUF937 family)
MNRFGESPATLWGDPLDRRLVLGVIGNLVSSGEFVSGLIKRAREAGLYPKLASWIGTRSENQTFSSDEIKRLVGETVVKELAEEVKAPEKEVLYRLARIVPQVTKQVLPAGEVNSVDVERIGLEAIRGNILSNAP